MNRLFSFLNRRESRILTVVLLLQSACLYGLLRRDEVKPTRQELKTFPTSVQGWQLLDEGVVEPEVQAVLKADDLLNRTYRSPDGKATPNLFIAYFDSQKTGKAPHSPKNCLPGSGWTPSVSTMVEFPVPGEAEPIRVNHYIVEKGDNRSVVLYWYQSHHRIVASEYAAKIYLVLDSARYRRSNASLVRIVVNASGGKPEAATQKAIQFAQAIYPSLSSYLP